MKIPYDRLTKICTNCFGHMTKMAAMPTYGKKALSIFSKIQKAYDLGLGMLHTYGKKALNIFSKIQKANDLGLGMLHWG